MFLPLGSYQYVLYRRVYFAASEVKTNYCILELQFELITLLES